MGRALLLSVVALAWLTNCKSKEASGGPAGAGAAGVGGGAAGVAVVGASGTSSAGSSAAGTAGITAAAAGSSPSSAAGATASAGTTGVAGCGSESFAAIYQSVFASRTYNCTGPLCHGRDASMAASVGSLSMSSAAVAYAQLVKVPSGSAMCSGKTRVVPGDPSGSLLVQKLRAETATCGASMPVNADQITDPELKRISDWIRAGACNN